MFIKLQNRVWESKFLITLLLYFGSGERQKIRSEVGKQKEVKEHSLKAVWRIPLLKPSDGFYEKSTHFFYPIPQHLSL